VWCPDSACVSKLIALVSGALIGLTVSSCSLDGYSPAPSLAGEMTPEWRDFAEQVDRACASNFNAGQSELANLDEEIQERGLTEDEGEAEYRFIQAKHQQDTYDEIAGFGEPPARPELFHQWLENVGTRAHLMRAIGQAWLAGDERLIAVRNLRLDALKIDADWLGQHFGLRICTSNGPSNNLDAGYDYLAEVDRECAQRTKQDYGLWRRGKFTLDAAAGTSTGETLSIAAVAPPTEQYPLRARILAMKRSIDRLQVRTLRRAASSPEPSAWLLRVQDRMFTRIVHERERLAELGLPDCAWPENLSG
jgi:hypothetical protein